MDTSLFDRAGLGKALAAAGKIDLTHPLAEGMPTWPTHPSFEQRAVSSIENGDASCNHALCLSEHTGTHFDAPAHFIRHGLAIDRIPPGRFFGRMATIDGRAVGADGAAGPELVLAWERQHGPIEAEDAVFFHFGWDRLWSDAAAFRAHWPGLAPETAQLLRRRDVRAVGSDCLSVDPAPSTGFEAHRILLGAGVLIGENFNNLGLLPPLCTLIALPLPIAGGSGSPLRAIALV
ncbi:cyclase family protein [Labrys wisconsinensis]|uniref:Kynurenine formamidase n=1 Tax=Labrys wisconsinensis TaxID=425677 RepID=A0ABU0JG38_9HYPH|nr:cyclase family protein [Labrys wisconsinensis]MDQ0473255.1 kynurenine formamidase [Labrys wisconsinensis]